MQGNSLSDMAVPVSFNEKKGRPEKIKRGKRKEEKLSRRFFVI